MTESQELGTKNLKFLMFECSHKSLESHVTCHMSNAYVDPWDMLNNFCFDVYAQKSLFIGENSNDFFWTTPSPSPVTLEFIELVPS